MNVLRVWQGILAVVALAVAVLMPIVAGGTPTWLLGLGQFSILIVLFLAAGTLIALKPERSAVADLILCVAAHLGGGLALVLLPSVEAIPPGGEEGLLAHIGARLAAAPGFWGLVGLDWLLAWKLVARLSASEPRQPVGAWLLKVFVPLLFGVWLLFVWETAVRGFGVPFVLLPPPSAIADRIARSTGLLTADFRQTFLKAVLAGYIIGSSAGFAVALIVDRVPFLKRGLLPIGNLVSALPIIGIAPIMVMWFGFDWPSKAAVVTVMTFFPMLVNTIAGLDAADQMQRDLMRTWGADHRRTVSKLRLPAALPFVFNGLKLNTTLAMIGAIVAEFFGTPIVGMGFRISTEVGRMNIDMVWAEIAVAALAGSVFYGVMALVERACTFWHPSFRRQ